MRGNDLEEQDIHRVSPGSGNRLLICADWFDPGIRAGGPIRSCMNLTTLLASDAQIMIITADRDLGVSTPYEGLPSDQWQSWQGRAAVQYCSSGLKRIITYTATLRSKRPDAVYLNSMFSIAGTLWPLLWAWLTRSRARIVLAPRGMLKPTALRQKWLKKTILIRLLKLLRITRGITFHATSVAEINEIQAAFGKVNIRHIPNVPSIPLTALPDHQKDAGLVRLCFIGRVHPIKNLLWLLHPMKALTTRCELTVIGPVEDYAYYELCQDAIVDLPVNVSVEFAGVQSPKEINKELIQSDAMVLPTQGENFGHAIFEAMAVGTPVIVSDRTIWRDLSSRKAGWDLAIDQPDRFASVIQQIAEMDCAEHKLWRIGALTMAQDFHESNDFANEFLELFFRS